MSRFVGWIKNNKLAFIIILVLVLWVFGRGILYVPFSLYNSAVSRSGSSGIGSGMDSGFESAPLGLPAKSVGNIGIAPPSYNQPAPQMDISERMVVTESYVSMQVQNVSGAIDSIKSETTNRGGYMVSSNLNSPEEGANGYITIRIPDTELDGMLDYLRELSVKVVSENIQGTDVTDQYVDIEERLRILNTTKGEFEGIYDSALTVDEKLKVMNQILSVQSQIESLQGRKQALEATSSSTLITIHLSTDEYSLPYAPTDGWRPEVIFKQAVRSLVLTLRWLGTVGIWLGVYAVLILPAVALFFAIKNMLFKKKEPQKDQQE